MAAMRSRERMLAAMRCEDVDRVPIPQGFWTLPPTEEQFSWADREDQIAWMKTWGFDPHLGMPLPFEGYCAAEVNPEIEQRLWQEEDPDEPYPILCSEWTSPKGSLSAKVRLTEDYPFDTVHFFSDYNTPRYVKPLLETGEDMLTFVRMDPYRVDPGWGEDAWREECRAIKTLADREGLAVCCNGGTSLDYLIWGSTAEQAIMLALDSPEETMAFLEYLNAFSDKRVEMSLGAGADYVMRRGWYESADFWSPAHFDQFAAPFIQREVDLAHQAGVPAVYLMCTGITPMVPGLAALGFDCLTHPEPVCTGQDLRAIADGLRPGKSFWTGLSAPIHIGRGTTEDVRRAVRDAFDIFGRQGFMLQAVPSIRKHWPWEENLAAMVDECRKLSA